MAARFRNDFEDEFGYWWTATNVNPTFAAHRRWPVTSQAPAPEHGAQSEDAREVEERINEMRSANLTESATAIKTRQRWSKMAARFRNDLEDEFDDWWTATNGPPPSPLTPVARLFAQLNRETLCLWRAEVAANRRTLCEIEERNNEMRSADLTESATAIKDLAAMDQCYPTAPTGICGRPPLSPML